MDETFIYRIYIVGKSKILQNNNPPPKKRNVRHLPAVVHLFIVISGSTWTTLDNIIDNYEQLCYRAVVKNSHYQVCEMMLLSAQKEMFCH